MPPYTMVPRFEEESNETWVNNNFINETPYEYYTEETFFDNNYTFSDAIDVYLSEEFANFNKVPFVVYFVISFLGVVFNILNIVVYSRRSMVSSINMLLLAFEAANVIFFMTYIARGIELYFGSKMIFTFTWTIYKKYNPYIRLASTCLSNWLAVTVGLWRCIAVGMTLKAGQFLSKTRAKLVITFLCVASPILTVPSLLLAWPKRKIIPHYNDYGELETNYTLYFFERDKNYPDLFFAFNIVTLIVTLLPVVILIMATLFLLFSLQRAARSRRLLVEYVESASQIRDRKMTVMLLVILGTFVVSYLPDAGCVCVLIHHYNKFLSGTLTWASGGACKILIMEGLFPLISNTITFFIYYLMSENFRETFNNLFMLSKLIKTFRRQKSAHSQNTDIESSTTVKDESRI